MEVFEFILIATFLIVSMFGIMLADRNDSEGFFKVIFFAITAILCLFAVLYEAFKLRDSDVLNGEAEYVETIHISKGDTIKTYHIQPKESK